MQKSSTHIAGTVAAYGCELAVVLCTIGVLWIVFVPELHELVCLSLWAGCLICQFKIAKKMNNEGVADFVTSIIFAVFLTPILYVVGWLYSSDWECRPLMFVWTGLTGALVLAVISL